MVTNLSYSELKTRMEKAEAQVMNLQTSLRGVDAVILRAARYLEAGRVRDALDELQNTSAYQNGRR